MQILYLDVLEAILLHIITYYYRPQGKVIFSQASVILSTRRGVSVPVHAGMPPGRHLSPGQTPPGKTPPTGTQLLQQTVCILLECILV